VNLSPQKEKRRGAGATGNLGPRLIALEQNISTNPDWSARTRTIKTVIERKGKQSIDTMHYTLEDINPSVRYIALSGTVTIGLALPRGTSDNLAQYDPSLFVRVLALRAIAEALRVNRLHGRRTAQSSLAGSHSDVLSKVRDVLATLSAADQSQTFSKACLEQTLCTNTGITCNKKTC
jgi:hypothetical protein